jgi:hypothetical protein
VERSADEIEYEKVKDECSFKPKINTQLPGIKSKLASTIKINKKTSGNPKEPELKFAPEQQSIL